MPGPDQRELPPFYMVKEDVVMQIDPERLRRMAERSFAVMTKILSEYEADEIVRDTHPAASREAELQAKLDSIIERLRRIEAELCGQDINGTKYNVEKRGAIWTASKP